MRYKLLHSHGHLLVALTLLLAVPLDALAKCGSVDYSQGADALAKMHDFVVSSMLYSLYGLNAGAGILTIISIEQIYIKINMGEQGAMKAILMLMGAILFMIGAFVVLPGFFGYQIL